MVRFKNRYLLVELSLERNKRPSSSAHLANIIRESIEYYFGDFGMANTAQSLSIKYYNHVTGIAIVRTGRDHLKMTKHAIENCKLYSSNITIVHVGGTIKSTQLAAIRLNEKRLIQEKQCKFV